MLYVQLTRFLCCRDASHHTTYILSYSIHQQSTPFFVGVRVAAFEIVLKILP
jgi:hypothetical protein